MSLLLGALCACQIASASPNPPSIAELVARARAARYQQDSALAGYVTLARQRWTASIGLAAAGGLGPMGRMRLGARFESVARMGWRHDVGAWGELLASRAVAPIVGEVEPDYADEDIVFVLPYYPGRDQLWPMSELGNAWDEAKDWIRHPLEAGSDSLYRFVLGGTLQLTLPGGRVVRLREIEVRPVRPSARLIVGSLWVDEANGALVRAAYRPSIAIDLWPMMEQNFDEGDREVFEKFGPFRGNVEEIVIEHGLFGERFWLPRVRIAHAEGTAKGGRVTMSIEQTFDYEKVDALPPGVAQQRREIISEAEHRRRRLDRYDDYRMRGDRTGVCRSPNDPPDQQIPFDSIPYLQRLSSREADVARVRVLFPCNPDRLLSSPLLPTSIYSPSEELFTEHDLNRLRAEVGRALDMGSQAAWAPQPATVQYGLDGGLWRYNRIEALSGGVRVERQLGRGYSYDALARLGIADLEPNGEFALRRENGRGALRVAAFRRLDVANEWGNPLGLSASLNALLLGQDNGIYHRALGVEVGGVHHRIASGTTFAWRLFGEEHRTAERGTTFSLARVVSGYDFQPNIIASEGIFAGGAASMTFAVGADPNGTQLSGALKGEAAGGEQDYGRGAIELRIGQGLGRGVVTALSGAAGGSLGTVPTQRLWYLGGPQTIHAYRPGAVAGDAYWLGRFEIAKGLPLVRPILFVDAGWAGSRRSFVTARRNALAVGIGAAAIDGLARVDLSRALDTNRWSFDIFIDVR